MRCKVRRDEVGDVFSHAGRGDHVIDHVRHLLLFHVLLTEGAYSVVRHPRYLSAGIGVIGNALIINYLGLYITILVLFSTGLVMLVFEERELVDRFGDPYRQYQREVPRIIPRFRKRR